MKMFIRAFSAQWTIGAVVATMAMTGCNVQTPNGEVSLTPDSTSSDPAYRMTRAEIVSEYSEAVCDPLYTNPEIPGDDTVMRGWFGEIRVPPANAKNSEWEQNLDRYWKPDAVLLSTPLYLQNLDVPTRKFTEGFPTMSGGLVDDESGNPLVERFHFNMESGLTLGDMHDEGEYEFAMLSDDGVRLSIDDVLYLNSPNHHATTLVCPKTTVRLTRGEIKALHAEYFQGPRYHIALQLLWRKVTPETKKETLCGFVSNDEWFDYSGPVPAPKKKYRELQARGWSVVPASSFVLPGYEPLNPCLSERVKEVLAEEQQ
ncbi:MAG TPA: PA14 domain-containing protein [Bdellovibrionota bacterium]|jgi:hypothetical protein|nr:PA14 domain-containing protein [Bdellovibrionota bacterium]